MELESREIEFGENYNEEEEERQARRLQKLTRRQLAIYRYLVKHEIIVDDDLNIMFVFILFLFLFLYFFYFFSHLLVVLS